MFEGKDLVGPNSNDSASPLPPKEVLPQPTENPAESPVPIINPNPTPPLKACHDSLAGLPQYDKASYGHGKR